MLEGDLESIPAYMYFTLLLLLGRLLSLHVSVLRHLNVMSDIRIKSGRLFAVTSWNSENKLYNDILNGTFK